MSTRANPLFANLSHKPISPKRGKREEIRKKYCSINTLFYLPRWSKQWRGLPEEHCSRSRRRPVLPPERAAVAEDEEGDRDHDGGGQLLPVREGRRLLPGPDCWSVDGISGTDLLSFFVKEVQSCKVATLVSAPFSSSTSSGQRSPPGPSTCPMPPSASSTI